MRLVVSTLLLVACATPPSRPDPMPGGKEPPPAVSSELTPALVPLAWWLGDWEGDAGSEHWNAAGGAIYGVAFARDGSFEVFAIDDGDGGGPPDGVLRMFATPNTAPRTIEFRKHDLGAGSVAFTNDSPASPSSVAYHRDADTLTAVISGGGHSATVAWKRTKSARAPELEAADLAFSADTGARGVDGWVAAFDPSGSMMRKGERVDGAAIAETMKGLLSSGKLAWAPIASGRSGDLGFTVGKATYTGATPADGWRSTYITIWHHQADGSWKVLFDTGRPVQEP